MQAVQKMHQEVESIIDQMYMDGKTDHEIDDAIGMTRGTTYRWRSRNECPPNGIPGFKAGEYLVYSSKSDLLLAVGTAQECAKALGMSRNSFYSMVCRVRAGKNKKYIVIRNENISRNPCKSVRN